MRSRTDCQFGPITEAATKRWQQTYGLTADGVVGPAVRPVPAAAPGPGPSRQDNCPPCPRPRPAR
ncbi:peptidoglycan-binding domain-containing protein [Streptomyces sp. NBC_01750]|uniref:peptidoglycan-binding domain-containing protein n=1 Tax=Streptomyces sp. NBC_01750 TaxID=2975928 RepID=UPI003FA371E6